MQSLHELIGKQVTLGIVNSQRAYYEVTLHNVEQGGIWVESAELDELVGPLRSENVSDGPMPLERPVFFIPYASVHFLVASSVALDEGAF